MHQRAQHPRMSVISRLVGRAFRDTETPNFRQDAVFPYDYYLPTPLIQSGLGIKESERNHLRAAETISVNKRPAPRL